MPNYNHDLDIIGRKFNKLQVVSIYCKNDSGNYLYKCICDCGSIRYKTSSEVKKMRSCGACDKTKFITENIMLEWWNRFIRTAKRRKIEVYITPEYLDGLWVKQKSKCYLSGLDIFLIRNYSDRNTEFNTASLDRIDSNLGYIEGNVAWCHKEINFLKSSLSKDEFIEMCISVSDYADSCTAKSKAV